MPGPGLERCRIQNLNPTMTNAFVVGQLIAKSDVHLFQRSQQRHQQTNTSSLVLDTTDGSDSVTVETHGVIKFTVRDAEHAFINCTVWGSDSYIVELAARFRLGDVMCVQRPVVAACKAADLPYQPLTSSPYQLTVSQRQSDASVMLATSSEELANADGSDQLLRTMLNVPVKPTAAALRLADLGAGSSAAASVSLPSTSVSSAMALGNASERFADLLVIVQKLWPVVKLGPGRFGQGERQMRKVEVLDESAIGVRLVIWNNGFVNRSDEWQEMSTVLQLIDVRCTHSSYRRCIELHTHGRTLILEVDARTRDTQRLRQFARSLPPQSVNLFDNSGPSSRDAAIDLASIRTVMTVHQVQNHIDSEAKSEFTALMFVVIAGLDLDGNEASVIVSRCGHCNRLLSRSDRDPVCKNEDCRQLSTSRKDTFDIGVELIDHSGSLRCRMRDAAAERLVGCLPAAWRLQSDRDRGVKKWQWLMERCAVKVRVRQTNASGGQLKSGVDVVDCQLATDEQVEREIKLY